MDVQAGSGVLTHSHIAFSVPSESLKTERVFYHSLKTLVFRTYKRPEHQQTSIKITGEATGKFICFI